MLEKNYFKIGKLLEKYLSYEVIDIIITYSQIYDDKYSDNKSNSYFIGNLLKTYLYSDIIDIILDYYQDFDYQDFDYSRYRIGIGVTNPASALVVKGAAALGDVVAEFRKETGDTTSSPLVEFYRSTCTLEGDIRLDGSSNLAFLDASDSRLKENIVEYTGGIDVIKGLRAVTFDWIDEDKPNNIKGFIADEVQGFLPKSVDMRKDGFLGLTKNEMMPVMWSALRELSAKNDALEARLDALEKNKK